MIRNYAQIILTVKQDHTQVNQSTLSCSRGDCDPLRSERHQDATADSQGRTIFDKLYSGSYVLTINKSGYLSKSWNKIIDTNASALGYDLQMEMTAAP
jgi:hypothetical protein